LSDNYANELPKTATKQAFPSVFPKMSLMPVAVVKNLPGGVWARARDSAVFYGSMGTILRAGANLLLLPLVLNVLRPPELALWYVFLALGALANLAEFGFGPAMSRVYSFLFAGAEDFATEGLGPPPQSRTPNLAGIARFHTAVRTVYSRIAGAAMLLLATLGTWCLLRPITGVSNPFLAWISWGGFILAVGFSLSTNHWMLACQGINRVRELQQAYLVSGVAYVIGAALLLVSGFGLMAMVIATGIRAVIVRELCRRAYLRAMPERADKRAVDVAGITSRIWPNARKFGIISLGAFLTAQANVLICSQLLGNEITASYAVTSQVGNFLVTFSALWLGVKWPEITILRTQGRVEEMAVLFARRLALVMATFGILAVVLLAFGNRVLDWKGTQTRFLPGAYLAVYLFYLFQQQFYVQFGSLVYTENEVPFYKLSVFSGIAVTAASIVLARFFGLWGLILAPLIVTVVSCAWYVPLRAFRGQSLNVRQFARAAVLGHL
jgi:O-antigen/teichoic acid export membrane protein